MRKHMADGGAQIPTKARKGKAKENIRRARNDENGVGYMKVDG